MDTVVIPTISKPVAPATASTTATIADLNKTHFVVNTIQQNVKSAITPVISNPVNNSVTLSSITLLAGKPNYINHMLGHTLQGWEISRPKAFSVLWEDPVQPMLDKQIILWTYIDTITDLIVW